MAEPNTEMGRTMMYGATFPMSSASSAIVVIGCRGKQLGDAGVQFHASTIRHRGRATRSVDKKIKGESKKTSG